MDPLSFTASLIAIITLTGTVTTSLNELRTVLKDAPDDLLTLLDEIKDFQAVLSGLRDIGPGSPPDAFLELSTLPSRATNKLLELEKILHHKILPYVPAPCEKPEVPKLRWLRVRGRIGAIREDLRDLRLQLVTALTSIMARRTLTAHTRLETIEISLKELGSGQRTIITEMTKSMSLALPSPSDLVPGSLPSLGEAVDSRISTSVTQEWYCDPWCACLCHKRQRWKMPMSLQNLLGDLYLGYPGAFFSRTECTETMCRRPSAQNTKFIYRLPPWLAARVIMADLGGPSPSLRAARVVERSAPIMQCSRNGDVEGIKMLFRSGLASPWDEDPIGQTPLLVSSSFETLFSELCHIVDTSFSMLSEKMTNLTWTPVDFFCKLAQIFPLNLRLASKLILLRIQGTRGLTKPQQFPYFYGAVLCISRPFRPL